MAVRKICAEKADQDTVIIVNLCPDDEQAQLQTQMQKLAKEIASSLSTF